MSAFFVNFDTLNDAVAAALYQTTHGTRSEDDCTALGRALWHMNAEAMCQRYPNIRDTAEDDEMRDTAAAYVFDRDAAGNNIVQQIKSLACLLYQCHEGDIPETSALYKAARAFCDACTDKIDADPDMKRQYEAASWGR